MSETNTHKLKVSFFRAYFYFYFFIKSKENLFPLKKNRKKEEEKKKPRLTNTHDLAICVGFESWKCAMPKETCLKGQRTLKAVVKADSVGRVDTLSARMIIWLPVGHRVPLTVGILFHGLSLFLTWMASGTNELSISHIWFLCEHVCFLVKVFFWPGKTNSTVLRQCQELHLRIFCLV